jgi:hypothetical protein
VGKNIQDATKETKNERTSLMPKITKQELIKLQKALATDEAIGKKFGITRQAVLQLLQSRSIVKQIERL